MITAVYYRLVEVLGIYKLPNYEIAHMYMNSHIYPDGNSEILEIPDTLFL